MLHAGEKQEWSHGMELWMQYMFAYLTGGVSTAHPWLRVVAVRHEDLLCRPLDVMYALEHAGLPRNGCELRELTGSYGGHHTQPMSLEQRRARDSVGHWSADEIQKVVDYMEPYKGLLQHLDYDGPHDADNRSVERARAHAFRDDTYSDEDEVFEC